MPTKTRDKTSKEVGEIAMRFGYRIYDTGENKMAAVILKKLVGIFKLENIYNIDVIHEGESINLDLKQKPTLSQMIELTKDFWVRGLSKSPNLSQKNRLFVELKYKMPDEVDYKERVHEHAFTPRERICIKETN